MANKPRTSIQDAQLFFKTLLHGARAEMGMFVLSKTEKLRQGLYDPTDIKTIAQDSVDNNCAYFKTALMDPSYFDMKAEAGKQHAMGGKKEAQYIFALHLDVDCNKPGYLKREAAITVLREMEKPPTIIVNSKGTAGGLHAYWCLTEPFDVRDPGELARAQNVQTSLRNEVHRLLVESGTPCTTDEGGVKRYLDDSQTIYRALRPAGSSRGHLKVSLVKCKSSERYDLDELMYDEVESRTVATSDMAMPTDEHYGAGDPGTDFMRSDHGVSELMLAMEDENYTFQRVDDYWSWKHPDSESENDCSGTLGIKSKQGNYLLTSFSPNTPFSNTGESITIFQAMADLKFDGDLRATASWLRSEGFGKQSPTQNEAVQGLVDNLLSKAEPSPEVKVDAKADDSQEMVDPLAGLSPEQMKGMLQAYYERLGMSQPCTSDELAVRDTTVDYIIRGVLAKDHPAFIAGFEKSLKTTIGADMAYSIATKTPFLSHQEWLPTKALKVHFCSAESGDATLKETFERIANRRNKRLADAGSNLTFSFNVPNAADPKALAIFETELAMYRPDVVIVDPVYFILSGDSDNNRSKFIHEFEKVTQIVKKYGATLVAIDHTNKSASSGEFEFRAPRLTDMNGTGRSSFARSWILTKRRSSYQHGKPHELYLSLGGSCLGVHGGRDYAVDIDETPDADEHDRGVRHYEVTMFEPLAKWQKEAKEAREIEKYESERDEQNEIKRKIQQNLWDAQKEVGDDFKGLTQSKATDGVGADRTSKKVKRAWEALTLPTGPVEESESQGKYVRFRLKHEVFAQGRPEDYEISLDVEGDIEFESITLGEVVRL